MKSITNLRDADHLIKDGTLIALDFDDTLQTATTHFGSQRWCEDVIRRENFSSDDEYQAAHNNFRNFKNKTIEPHLTFTPVQEDVAQILSDWKTRGAKLMVLTARRPERAEETEKSLRTLGILDMLIQTTGLGFKIQQEALFENGVCYCNNFNGKANTFIEVNKRLKDINSPLSFSSFAFFDDSEEHASSMNNNLVRLMATLSSGVKASAVKDINIFHYTATSALSTYDPTIAALQEHDFYNSGCVMSNEAAEAVLGQMSADEIDTMKRVVLAKRAERIANYR